MSTDTAVDHSQGQAVSRNPSEYFLSLHANQRRKDRDITKEAVADTIAKGDLRSTHRSHVRLFVHERPGDPDPIGVSVDIHDQEILTVMWRE